MTGEGAATLTAERVEAAGLVADGSAWPFQMSPHELIIGGNRHRTHAEHLAEILTREMSFVPAGATWTLDPLMLFTDLDEWEATRALAVAWDGAGRPRTSAPVVVIGGAR